jgi:transposase-like protein
MAQYICPSCGSTYFLTSKAGLRTIFQVVHERTVQCVQSGTGVLSDEDIDIHTLYCGACSWQGSLDEVVESHRD